MAETPGCGEGVSVDLCKPKPAQTPPMTSPSLNVRHAERVGNVMPISFVREYGLDPGLAQLVKYFVPVNGQPVGAPAAG